MENQNNKQEISKKTFEKKLDEMVKNCGKKVSDAISDCNEKATETARGCYDCAVRYRKNYEKKLESQKYFFRYYILNGRNLCFDAIEMKKN